MDDEGGVGVDDEFDIYEDLQLDAIPVSGTGEDGEMTEGNRKTNEGMSK